VQNHYLGEVGKRDFLIAYLLRNISAKNHRNLMICVCYNEPKVGLYWDTVWIDRQSKNTLNHHFAKCYIMNS